MAVTVGATHTLTTTGEIAISGPVGLALSTSTVPAPVGVRVGAPYRYFGLGHVAWGTALGFMRPVPIRHAAQLEYPLPDGLTRLGVTLAEGVVLQVQELVGSAAAAVSAEWFDRSPEPWGIAPLNLVAGGTGETTNWTYTVPAGKKLWVSKLRCYITEHQTATTAQYVASYLLVNGTIHVQAMLGSANRPHAVLDEMGAGPLVLAPGGTIMHRFYNADAGGLKWIGGSANGTLFTA